MSDDRPTLDYNGRTVVFREEEDEWYCHALRLSAPKLSTLKAKIDRLDAKTRRVSVSALCLENYGGPRVENCSVVMVAKAKDWDRPSLEEQRGGAKFNDRVPTVWIMVAEGNSNERRKVRLDRCFLPTESNLATLQAAKDIRAEIERLEQAEKETLDMIPRLTLEELTSKGAKEEDLDE